MAKRPGGAMLQTATPTQSELIPILTKWGDLGNKAQLWPMIITLAMVMMMFAYSDSTAPLFLGENVVTSQFIILMAVYLTLLNLYFIYRQVGKRKSWLPMMACLAFTGLYLVIMQQTTLLNFVWEFFHIGLAGGTAKGDQPFFTQFYRHFIGTGFFEELVKVLPLFVIMGCLKFMSPAMQQKFKIEEPLDGVLLGAASGGGFALIETVGQYVSNNLMDTWVHAAKAMGIPLKAAVTLIGTAPGVQLLIPRLLGDASGHMAYSGLFGYFIGLSVMRPERRWTILAIGLVSSALPHALWDSAGAFGSDIIYIFVGALSYAVLAAAILKAREISPNRVLLQPSVVFGNMGSGPAAAFPAAPSPAPAPNPAYAAPAQPFAAPQASPAPAQPATAHWAPAAGAAVIQMQPQAVAYHNPPVQMMPQPNELPPAPPNLPPGTLSLRLGARYLVIVPGLRILEHQIPGLRPLNAGQPVAEITRNPQDPTVLGLTNLSGSSWAVTTPAGGRREILSGQTVKIASGTRFDFGGTDGEIR